MYFRAVFCGMIEQQFVEVSARHLISVIGLRAICVFEIKLVSLLGTRAEHFAAEFFHESGARNFFVQIHARECFHAERQKRFADMETREFFPFEDNDTTPGFA